MLLTLLSIANSALSQAETKILLMDSSEQLYFLRMLDKISYETTHLLFYSLNFRYRLSMVDRYK